MDAIEIEILGQKYTLKGEADKEHIKKLAGFLNTKISEVINASPRVAPIKAVILAALSISDDLFKLKEENKKIDINTEELERILEKS
jgi:cell division protein ZapA